MLEDHYARLRVDRQDSSAEVIIPLYRLTAEAFLLDFIQNFFHVFVLQASIKCCKFDFNLQIFNAYRERCNEVRQQGLEELEAREQLGRLQVLFLPQNAVTLLFPTFLSTSEIATEDAGL